MNRSKTARAVAFVASLLITFTLVSLIADYAYQDRGVPVAAASARAAGA